MQLFLLVIEEFYCYGNKVFKIGNTDFAALSNINLDIKKGENIKGQKNRKTVKGSRKKRV